MNKKIKETIQKITPINFKLMEKAQKRLDNLTKPQGSLGRLEDFAGQIVGISGNLNPEIKRKVILVMAGDHGVAQERVSAFPQEVTFQMVYNFIRGGAGINVLARHIGADVLVVDMGVAKDFASEKGLIIKKIAYGTKNIAQGPAMSRDEAERAIMAGIEVFEDELSRKGIDIVGLGEMGIANTTPSSAIVACLTKSKVEEVTGQGTGINEDQLKNKIRVIKQAIEINHPDPEDGLDVLSKIGGFEIGGLVGCILAAAAYRVPIVIDGFISCASTLIAIKLAPLVKDYILASHNSMEKGHKIALKYIGKVPMFDLGMRLGEGTGAALGISFIEAGVKILTQMATFSDAGVENKKV
ncbi:MAG: nicotinate-nucleotide--dimethylbenzimidazole phosphoribosyltransferase [Candidatus Infernicultor aquiphilus]|uniref:Nicotinate-nucleotide--dimethylbenzimidazole phosphoribosyltransferase n=1 Tax=Candidatus Infernicultor aquiphilus TaxID=1805029 RepID=A0A1J5GVX0_9BACT|nr:nicotinate-nucleotide--dimethylbenzimidazole phosphoribosyltransferase [bacterium]OIP71958.1 MAG: nicotinate-nucleotide--dimethylbenzimidazole phosphoribosyltransferase [Candidatus Atribacteria bacterium CG2_30_33_13]PIU24740.1 MAG: nicotinate-nucleotide--dimethylbenzimidazole phosphoribosyltransferase [Candidatus Atribacteria bacterium CG08_land_8_20_14_0_20_33_29]PIW11170.1 MAG: nicotinate-nucleotide--dimethylbenzimidazole phosphoribosyltransferase [Candidatus Atribacteria bacterium CG17_bi